MIKILKKQQNKSLFESNTVKKATEAGKGSLI